MSKRCHICDGPIVNGRCKFCGMPYRNDEDLYHLNESRSEHYRHASNKIRREMDENQIPLADRQAAQVKQSRAKQTVAKQAVPRQRTAAVQGNIPRNMAPQPNMQRNTVPQPNVQRNTVQQRTVPGTGSGRTTTSSGKKKSGVRWLFILVVILLGSAPEAVNYVNETLIPKIESMFHTGEQETPVERVLDESDLEELTYIGYLTENEGPISAGSDGEIAAGIYRTVITDGYVTVQVEGNDETAEYQLGSDELQAEITVTEGQTITLLDADDGDRQVDFYCVEVF